MEVFYEKGKKYNCRVKGVPYWRTSVTINGRRKQVYGDGEKDALRKKNAILDKVSKGYDLDKNRSKVGDALEFWLYNVKRVDKNVKASSFARYESIYRNHIKDSDLLFCTFEKLNSEAFQIYVTALYEKEGKSNSTIDNIIKVWNQFFLWCIEKGYLVKNPKTGVSIPGDYEQRGKKRKIIIFNSEERKKILDYMNESCYQYDAIIKLAFATGMRLSELLALEWRNVFPDHIVVEQSTGMVVHVDADKNRVRSREVWETKTSNGERTIPILPETYQMIKEHRTKQASYFLKLGLGRPTYVFTTSNGQLIESSSFDKSYKRMLKRAGVPVRKFHTIRHTFGTEAIRRGVNVKDLQMLMGHGDIETTYIYVQSDDESKKNAIERMGAII